MQTSMPNSEEEVKTVGAGQNEPVAETQESQEVQEEVSAGQDNASSDDSNATIRKDVISFEKVQIYQRQLLVLNDVSFTVKPGEFVYLIGRTGTGKSSILKTLIADVKPRGEKAEMIGYDLLTLKDKKIPELRKKIGMVFQDYQLLQDKTVIENLMFVLRATRWKDKNAMLNRCEEVLALVGLETKDFKLPSQLSGGEQQRVCIARALLNNPDVILADEPTGNLDPFTAEEIFQIFLNINKSGTTVLMATHNFNLINKFPSRTILIEDGHILDSGV